MDSGWLLIFISLRAEYITMNIVNILQKETYLYDIPSRKELITDHIGLLTGSFPTIYIDYIMHNVNNENHGSYFSLSVVLEGIALHRPKV